MGVKDNRLNIKISSPAAGGKANAELIKLLSNFFKLPQSGFSIKAGISAPLKTLIIKIIDKKKKEDFISKVSSLHKVKGKGYE